MYVDILMFKGENEKKKRKKKKTGTKTGLDHIPTHTPIHLFLEAKWFIVLLGGSGD